MKKEFGILFKEDIDFKDKKYKSGYAYLIDNEIDANSLCRQGCIYASKDAKYYSEEKIVAPAKKVIVEEVKPVVTGKVIEDEAKKNVVNKEDIKQTKVQGKSTNKIKFSK
tara:strand:- start:9795 stop:10124 length:330 start_codon:yes stop_codon:yes gene_type:complete